ESVLRRAIEAVTGRSGEQPRPPGDQPEGPRRADRQGTVRRRRASVDRRLHPPRGARLRELRGGSARSSLQERGPVVRRLQGATERARVSVTVALAAARRKPGAAARVSV